MFTEKFEKVSKEKDDSSSATSAATGALFGPIGAGIHGSYTAPKGEKVKRLFGVGGGSLVGAIPGAILHSKGHKAGSLAAITGGAIGAGLAHKSMKKSHNKDK